MSDAQEIAEIQALIGDCGDLEAMRRMTDARIIATFDLVARSFDPVDMSREDISDCRRKIGQSLIDRELRG